jgi:hypothetical protein
MSRILMRITAALAAVGLGLTAFGASAAAAAGAPLNGQGPNNGTSGGHLFGAYVVTTVTGGTAFGVCITPTLASPDELPADKYTVVQGGATPGNGITSGEAAALSYLGARYSFSGWTAPTGHRYSGPTVAAGVAQLEYLAHGGQTIDGGNESSSGALMNWAETYPGPWSITVTAGAKPYTAANTHRGTLTVHDGHPGGGTVPGIEVTVSGVTAGASVVMAASTTNALGQIAFTWSDHAGGGFSFTFGVAASPGGAPSELLPPTGSNGQTLMEFASVPIATTANWSTKPRTQTTFGALQVHKTDTVPDSAGGLLPLAGAKFHISGPTYTESTLTTPKTGTLSGQTVQGSTLTHLHPGTYTVTETSPPPGFGLASPATQTVEVFTTATATVSFADPPTPAKLVTTTSSVFLHSGETVQDGIKVSTLPTNAGINSTVPDETPMNWLLVGPVAMDPTGQCSASDYAHGPNAGSGQIALDGNGTYTTPPVTVHDAGCYGWIDSIPSGPYTQGGISFPNAPAPSSELSYLLATITTAAHATGSAAPATVSDTVTVGAITTEPSHITWSLFGPVAPVAGGACPTTAGAYPLSHLISAGTLDVKASGTYKVTAGSRSKAGCYSFGAELASTATPRAYNPVSEAPGTTAETLYVAPTITTAAHSSEAGLGAQLSDTVTITGVTGTGAVLHWELLGPVPPAGPSCPTAISAPTAWTTAATAASGTRTVTTSGVFSLAPTPPKTGGCYSWAETLTSASTPALFEPVRSTPGAAPESSFIAPVISTSATPSYAVVGRVLEDRVTVKGEDDEPATLTGTLYGPLPVPKTGHCGAIATATWAGHVVTHATLTLSANGVYTLDGGRAPGTGCVAWGDVLHLTTMGVTVASGAATPTEQSQIGVPLIATTAQSADALAGQALSDTVTVSGDDGEDGTLHATLYGPVAPADGSCAGLSETAWTAAAGESFTVPITGTGAVNVPPRPTTVKATAPGCYGWGAVLTLSTSRATATSAPTVVAEQTLVDQPGVATVASAHVVVAGGTLSDRVSVTGMTGRSGTLTDRLYGPLAPPATGCSALTAQEWTTDVAHGTPVATTITGTEAGNETVTLGPSGPLSQVGCYRWIVTLAVATQNLTSAGSTAEGAVVLAPAVATVATDHLAVADNTMTDQVTVSGLDGTPGILTGTLFGPLPPPNGHSCVGITWAHAPVAGHLVALHVTRDGTYTTAPTPLPASGCYSYAETLSADGVTVHNSPAGYPTETVLAIISSTGSGTVVPGTATLGGGTGIDTGGGKLPPPGGLPLGAWMVLAAALGLAALTVVRHRATNRSDAGEGGGQLPQSPLWATRPSPAQNMSTARRKGPALMAVLVLVVGAAAVLGATLSPKAAAATGTPITSKAVLSTHSTQEVGGGVYALNDVTCPTPTHCVAVGGRGGANPSAGIGLSSGVVVLSTSGGKSWALPTATVPKYLSGTQHDQAGAVVGGPSCGAGATTPADAWNNHGCYELSVVRCSSATRCLAAGGGEGSAYLWRTTDGGAEWTDLSSELPGNGGLGGAVSLAFTTASAGNAVLVTGASATPPAPSRIVLITNAYSASPTFHTGTLPGGTNTLEDIVCTSATVCLGVGSSAGYPATYRSQDGGANWIAVVVTADGKGSLTGVACTNATDCLAVGRIVRGTDRATFRAVAVTEDAGSTWTLRPLGWIYSSTTVQSGFGIGGYEFTGALSCATTTCTASEQFLTSNTAKPSEPALLVTHLRIAKTTTTLERGTTIKLNNTGDLAATRTHMVSPPQVTARDGVVLTDVAGSAVGFSYSGTQATVVGIIEPAEVAVGNMTCSGSRCLGTSLVGEETAPPTRPYGRTGVFETYTIGPSGTISQIGTTWRAPVKTAGVESQLICIPGKATCFRGFSPVNNTTGAVETGNTVLGTPTIKGELTQAERTLAGSPSASSGGSLHGEASCTATACYLVSSAGLLALSQSGTKLTSVAALTPMPPNYRFAATTTKAALTGVEVNYDGGLTCAEVAGKGTCLLPTTDGIYQSPMTGPSLKWSKVSTLITYTSHDRTGTSATSKVAGLTGTALACSADGETCLAYGPKGAMETSLTTTATSVWHAVQVPPLSTPTAVSGQHPGSNLVCVTSGQCAFAVVTYSGTFTHAFPFTLSTVDVTENAGTSWSQTPLGIALHPSDQADTTLSCQENTALTTSPSCFLSVVGFPSWFKAADTAATASGQTQFGASATAELAIRFAPAVAPPTITTLSPTTGTTTGGTTVTITGTCLTAPSAVTFGGSPAQSFKGTSPTKLTAVTEAHAAGKVAVALTSKCGTVTDPAAFTYVSPPKLVSTPATPTPSVPAKATSQQGPVQINTGGGKVPPASPSGTAWWWWLLLAVVTLAMAGELLRAARGHDGEPRWVRRRVVVAAVAVAVLGSWGWLIAGSGAPAGLIPKNVALPAAASLPVGAFAQVAPPVALAATEVAVPSLGIEAPITVERIVGHELVIPADVHIVGRYATGAAITAPAGTTLLAGHINWVGQGDGAFYPLSGAKPGTFVYVAGVHGTTGWQVSSVQAYPKSDLPQAVFDRSGPRRLVLVTCGGSYDPTTGQYADNIVVTAAPVQLA